MAYEGHLSPLSAEPRAEVLPGNSPAVYPCSPERMLRSNRRIVFALHTIPLCSSCLPSFVMELVIEQELIAPLDYYL